MAMVACLALMMRDVQEQSREEVEGEVGGRKARLVGQQRPTNMDNNVDYNTRPLIHCRARVSCSPAKVVTCLSILDARKGVNV